MIKRRLLLTQTSMLAASIGLPRLGYAAEPVLGLSLPVTGPQSEVAKDLLAGYELAMKSSGGRLQLRVLDDGGVAEKTAGNVELLAADPQVIGLSGIVGTPHAKLALPVAVKMGLPVVGIRSGASSLRNGQEGVFHLRASFEDELDKIAGVCSGAGVNNIIIIYSDDSFGKDSNTHLTQKLDTLGIKSVTSAAVERNGVEMIGVLDRLGKEAARTQRPTAIVLLLISKPMVEAVKVLREKYFIMLPIFAMSFVATKSLMVNTDPALAGLGMVTAFPLISSLSNVLASQFKADIAKYEKMDLAKSLTGFEGYLYGSIFARAALADGTRASITKRLNAGINFADRNFNFDNKKVGFHYLEVLRKAAGDGKFRA